MQGPLFAEAGRVLCRYGAGKVSSGANVDGAPLPEDVEENGKEEEVGEFGFHTLVSQQPQALPAPATVQACLHHASIQSHLNTCQVGICNLQSDIICVACGRQQCLVLKVLILVGCCRTVRTL